MTTIFILAALMVIGFHLIGVVFDYLYKVGAPRTVYVYTLLWGIQLGIVVSILGQYG